MTLGVQKTIQKTSAGKATASSACVGCFCGSDNDKSHQGNEERRCVEDFEKLSVPLHRMAGRFVLSNEPFENCRSQGFHERPSGHNGRDREREKEGFHEGSG